MPQINWSTIRNEFPILLTKKDQKPLVYLDNSATSQKPIKVLNAIDTMYRTYNANIHRGIYSMSEETTKKYTESKIKVASFINAPSYETIIYTKNATESINTVCLLIENEIHEGDEILISIMEHHSNLIPWVKLAKRKGAIIKYIPIDSEGSIDIKEFYLSVNDKTKVLAISHVSNVLGTINPIKQMIQAVKERGGYAVIDGAQAVGHITVDVTDLNGDFYAFSGHKMLAPTGIGVLYASKEFLENHEPLFYGGEMVDNVTIDEIVYKPLPWKFEAGTQNYEGGIALGEAVDYLMAIGIDNIKRKNDSLRIYLEDKLKEIEGIKIYGNAMEKSSVTSFTLNGVHPHDIASLLDRDNVCIRAGNHCAQPLVTSLNCGGSLARASLHFYNNEEDIDIFIKSLEGIKKLFANG